MESQPSYTVKPNGYSLICCRQCGHRQRIEIGADPEGWVKVTKVRGKLITVLCPTCAGGLGGG